ncbi:sulfhydryl oxidase 1-like [Uloborus diversus]|uniref:sulfhydryl oxidase 1-like n=1 Tax=Uloborus diversus TaxID=327109 RepID=UPI002409E395|nr:sulfhydryl oxidase 1-like [Uloborus diversus]
MKFLHFCTLIFYFIFLLFIALGSAISLYSPEDPLWELDGTNFERIVLGKSNAWIIEFYNNWCGHCIRYAPTWKEFAKDTKTWRRVVDVAVVNCADSQNDKLCRAYGVNSFPTIKVFSAYTNKTDKGIFLEGNRDVSSVEVSLIKFLESNWNENVPTKWSILHPLENSNVRNILETVPESEESVTLFIEFPDSHIGRKVIMDLSFQDDVNIRRVLTTNTLLLADLKTPILNSSVPSVIRIHRSGEEESLFKFSKTTSEKIIRDEIFKYFTGQSRRKSDLVSKTDMSNRGKLSSKGFVHMVDLQNAVHYALKQEVGIVNYIYGQRLDALKDFLFILKAYFPGTDQMRTYLSKLHKSVENKKNMTGEEFTSEMEQIQDDLAYLPKMEEYVFCKGSNPKYRGYPCSLWTLFHTLTVQAFSAYEYSTHVKENEPDILQTIRKYVKYFFTCEDCSKHFQEMAANSEKVVKNPRDAVLWLWEAHNRVNKRLAGDLTEDPSHPKVQFPTPEMCPKCRIEDSEFMEKIQWDEGSVLRFLQHFYNREKILSSVKNQDSSMAFKDSNSDNSAMVSRSIIGAASWLCLTMLYYVL